MISREAVVEQWHFHGEYGVYVGNQEHFCIWASRISYVTNSVAYRKADIELNT